MSSRGRYMAVGVQTRSNQIIGSAWKAVVSRLVMGGSCYINDTATGTGEMLAEPGLQFSGAEWTW